LLTLSAINAVADEKATEIVEKASAVKEKVEAATENTTAVVEKKVAESIDQAPPVVKETAAQSDIIATVNGTTITVADRTLIAKQLIARGQQADDARITEELISLELMKQEAIKLGLDKAPETTAQLELLNTRVLANATIAALGKDIKIADDDIQKEYDQQMSKVDRKEFKASHILLKDEEAAKAVIEELKGGAEFAEVAKEKSTGPSGPNGGDLGWFNSKSMVPEFSAAVALLKAEEVSPEPVKTQFGYHVIKLIDTRDAEAPKLEQVKGEIQAMLTQKKLSEKIDALRSTATIEMAPAK
jgi:peptidyl-prolyl cis-trans isomerase C